MLAVYYIAPPQWKNFLLLAGSLIFYAWGEPKFIFIMLISIMANWLFGLAVDKFRDNKRAAHGYLTLMVLWNVSIFFVYKYLNFTITNVNALFGTTFPLTKFVLPIGISFYTFQSMSYTIDLYLRNIKVQKSFLNFASYVSLFPQIVAGPIVRYEDVANELESRTVNIAKISAGIGLFVKGLAKKVLLANNIGMVWTQIKAMDYSTISVATAWLGIIAFAFQIYFDFSGYSDMATGLGKMLGFEFPKNFDHPYISKSISEFWRRWHITLGSWFRSYVYIPLGGNRNGNFKTYRNLFITWALTGLWHGASWNFILWGLFFGVLIIIERLGFGKILEKLPSAVSMLYTFVMVLFGWVLFDTDTLADAGRYYAAMFGAGGSLVDSYARYTIASNAVMLTLCILISGGLGSRLISFCEEKNKRASAVTGVAVKIGGLLICTAYLVGATYNPFLYFRF